MAASLVQGPLDWCEWDLGRILHYFISIEHVEVRGQGIGGHGGEIKQGGYDNKHLGLSIARKGGGIHLLQANISEILYPFPSMH